jgi:cell division protein FtsL
VTRSRRPRLRAVDPGPVRPRFVAFLIASFALIGSLVLGVVSLQALASQGSFRMQELDRRNAELAEANGRLQLQIAELSAPGRIQREAKRLGFVLPDPDQIHTIVLGAPP